ncbi:hypothetical protein [Candidatus Enterococcus mangumiae]|uniref:Uncharacterized protein n=1 Tax=Candidatus Enterococcus mangumiae TaxID=2230878 RepID=A0ABZ2SVR0_9ENTE|nr:hypothetical protein [Enterococcus sp. DIV1094]MBO0489302.1 hypothetical protein [Enterococcus sp. DIV1094]
MKIILSNILRNVILALYASVMAIGIAKILSKQELVILHPSTIGLILGLATLGEQTIQQKLGKLKVFLLLFLLSYTFEKTLEYLDSIKISVPLHEYLWIMSIASLGACFYYLRHYFVKKEQKS